MRLLLGTDTDLQPMERPGVCAFDSDAYRVNPDLHGPLAPRVCYGE